MFTTIDVTARASNLPRIADYTDQLLALPGLISWHTAAASTLTLDGDGRVTEWRSILAGGPAFAARTGANRPLWSRNTVGARGLEFTTPREDVLDFAGQLPFGAAAQFSAFLVVSLPSDGVYRHLMGHDTTNVAQRRVLSYNNNNIRATIDGGQPNADVAWPAFPAGLSWLVGFAHDAAANSLAAYRDGQKTVVASAAEMTQGNLTLGHTATDERSGSFTIHDVFLFSTDVLSGASTTPALLQAYANGYRA